MSKFKFKNKTAYITGGSRGLGLSLAWNILNRGGNVALIARDQEELADAYELLLREYPANRIMIDVCDITKSDQLHQSFHRVVDHFEGIDVVINNAGAILVGPFAAMKIEDFEAQMRLHLFAVIEIVQMAREHFKSRGGGRILNVCSLGGKLGVPHMAPYDASKFALAGFAQGVRGELALEKIFMTTAFPTVMRTGSPIQAVFKGDQKAEFSIFETLDNLPFLSMSADKAAKRMLDAVESGKSEVVLSLAAKARLLLGVLFPDTMNKAMDMATRILPKDSSKIAKTGAETSNRKIRSKDEKMYNQKSRHTAEYNLGLESK